MAEGAIWYCLLSGRFSVWIISFLLLVWLLLTFLILSHLCSQYLVLISAYNPHFFSLQLSSPAGRWVLWGILEKALSWEAPFLLMDIMTDIWGYRKRKQHQPFVSFAALFGETFNYFETKLLFSGGFQFRRGLWQNMHLRPLLCFSRLSLNGFCREGDAEWSISELSGLRDVWMPANLFLSIMGYNSVQVWYQSLFLLEKVRIKSRRLMEHKMLVYIADRAVCVALHVWSILRYTSPLWPALSGAGICCSMLVSHEEIKWF